LVLYFAIRGYGGDEKRARVNGRIGFRTRSGVEILDDGFKWRKYGKKAVKNSPNPRLISNTHEVLSVIFFKNAPEMIRLLSSEF
jgi:hypothetical protein